MLTQRYEYTVNVDKDVDSIDITATANDPEATVSIGENTSGDRDTNGKHSS
ncbi:MAG: cadherin-like beta sandwich domain-containing protein [Peptococcia bacterium]